jgi:hypothetical protein
MASRPGALQSCLRPASRPLRWLFPRRPGRFFAWAGAGVGTSDASKPARGSAGKQAERASSGPGGKRRRHALALAGNHARPSRVALKATLRDQFRHAAMCYRSYRLRSTVTGSQTRWLLDLDAYRLRCYICDCVTDPRAR